MKYVYPAIFTTEGTRYNVLIPDLPGCCTFGDTLIEAVEMARDAVAMWLCDSEDENETVPEARNAASIEVEPGSFVSLIDADTDEYRRQKHGRAVKKTLTIPLWLNKKAEKAGINFSQTLQRALIKELERPGSIT